MKEAVLRGAKLIVIDPRRIELAAIADIHLQLRPGSERRRLQWARPRHRARQAWPTQAFLAGRVDREEEYRAFIAAYDPERVEELSGVPAKDLERAAHLYADDAPRRDLLRSRRHRAVAGGLRGAHA